MESPWMCSLLYSAFIVVFAGAIGTMVSVTLFGGSQRIPLLVFAVLMHMPLLHSAWNACAAIYERIQRRGRSWVWLTVPIALLGDATAPVAALSGFTCVATACCAAALFFEGGERETLRLYDPADPDVKKRVIDAFVAAQAYLHFCTSLLCVGAAAAVHFGPLRAAGWTCLAHLFLAFSAARTVALAGATAWYARGLGDLRCIYSHGADLYAATDARFVGEDGNPWNCWLFMAYIDHNTLFCTYLVVGPFLASGPGAIVHWNFALPLMCVVMVPVYVCTFSAMASGSLFQYIGGARRSSWNRGRSEIELN